MNGNKGIALADYQALAQFRYQMRRFLRFSEDAARQAGLEPQQHQLMLAVQGVPTGEVPRIAYLAERLQIQHHSAVELVDRLEKKGMVTRNRSEQDRREVYIQLTSRGARVLGELTQHTRAELRLAAPALVATLRKLTLRKVASQRGRPRSKAQKERGRPRSKAQKAGAA